MRYPAAIWRPGPTDKQSGGVNKCRGVVMHSMVGSFAAAMGELDKPARRASWHYSVCQSGDVFAHYEDEAQTWHAGSARNNDLIGIEHEGGLNPYDEPLTPPQLAASVALVRWLAREHGFGTAARIGIWEHNWVSGAPTACPSHRIPFEAYQDQEDDDMTTERVWDGARTWIVGKGGASRIEYPAMDRPLEAIYGPHTRFVSAADLGKVEVK